MAAFADPALVAAVLADPATAPIDARLRATLAWLEIMTTRPQTVTEADTRALLDAGVSREAAEEALYVAFNFGVMDRLADAFGFELTAPEDLPKVGRLLLRLGYGTASVPG